MIGGNYLVGIAHSDCSGSACERWDGGDIARICDKSDLAR